MAAAPAANVPCRGTASVAYPTMPVIKRYSNRKLYDTQAKQYVTLDSLAALVRQGLDVSVIDHVSGEDITVLTLAQIIVEQEKAVKGRLPQAVLAGMIQASHKALSQLRWGLPWPASEQSQIDAEISRRMELLVQSGAVTEADGARLTQQLAAAGERAGDEDELDEAAIERRLRQRGAPTHADWQALAQQVADLTSEVERLSAFSIP